MSESEEKTTKVTHGDIIEMLLEHGAKVDLPNNNNNIINKMHTSASCMCVCKRLLEH